MVSGKTTHEDIKGTSFIQHPFDTLNIFHNMKVALFPGRSLRKFRPRDLAKVNQRSEAYKVDNEDGDLELQNSQVS